VTIRGDMINISKAKVLVIGSLNHDIVLYVSRMPVAGETLSSEGSLSQCGGKGANQAVACARLGASVSMIARVGDDSVGPMLRSALEDEAVDVENVMITDGEASGVAVVLLTPEGENRIILASGANGMLTPQDIASHSSKFDGIDLLICQLEVPIATVAAAVAYASARKIPILLNAAPAIPLPTGLLPQIDYLILNETEAAALSGITVRDKMFVEDAAALYDQGPRCVVVTLGAAGIVIADEEGCRHLPALPTTVMDTTAAGDSFVGGYAKGIVEGMTVEEAATLGLRVARVCVSRQGAHESLPRRQEV